MTAETPPRQEFPPPRANPDLLGHEAVERTLLRALRSGRLPHAWLITGPRGIGKATLAYRFARFVLSGGAEGQGGALFGAAPEGLRVDPGHEVFRRVASGGHADLRTLERGVDERSGKVRTEIVVGDVRAVGAFLRMTSGEGGWRVVVADPIDDLNRSAANALLKVLEEPPARGLLLLVSHAPGGLLPTIRSRCSRLPLSPLPEAAVAGLLESYAPALEAGDRQALARLAEGSIGRALDLAAGGGLELYGELVEVLSGLPRLDAVRVHALGDRLAQGADGSAFRTGTELLVWWLARMIRGGAEGRLPPEVVPGEGPVMRRLLERRALAQWLGLWEKITRLFARAEAVNLDRKQVVITAFLEFEAVAS
ncbi:MAG: DNA polymerase III subunit delta' [Kiloniellaceae bacterium]